MGSRFKFDLAHTRHKEEIAQIRNTGTAQVGQTESEQCRVVILIAGRYVIVIEIGIGAHLNPAEWDLCTGVGIAESGSSHQRADILGQLLLGHVIAGLFGTTGKRQQQCATEQRNGLSEHGFHHLSVLLTGFDCFINGYKAGSI